MVKTKQVTNLDRFKYIQQKLQGFIRKYYTNELIKGGILFVSFGLVYFLFTLLIEYFFWLKPTARTILFWIFILVEVILLVNYLVIPIFKLIGFSKGISLSATSKIIGKHFPDIDDKLLNVLQLHDSTLHADSNTNLELLLASINQKALSLQHIPFLNAIRFSSNKKYLKYLSIPLLIWLFTTLSGRTAVFSESYNRVLHHQTAYIPPAPFSFTVLNKSLDVIQGNSIQIQVQIDGDYIPDEPKIVFNREDYFLKHKSGNHFYYEFEKIISPVIFYFAANTVQSKTYTIKSIPTPKINGLHMYLDYPNYIGKSNESVANTGSISMPSGTHITWKVDTEQTDSLHFVTNTIYTPFVRASTNQNIFSKSITLRKSLNYSIEASNSFLSNHEKLSFTIDVVPDEYPSLYIETDIDSISSGEAQFIGNLTDDYGLSKFVLVYYLDNNPSEKYVYPITIDKGVMANFYYLFPTNLTLQDGKDYAFYFELFDNDAVAGLKSVKSKTFRYHKDTNVEEQDKLLQEGKKSLDELQNELDKQEFNQHELEEFHKELQKKTSLEFNDAQKFQSFLKRQTDYQEMMQRQKETLQRNLNNHKDLHNTILKDKKEALQQRLQDQKALAKQEKLLEELKKMADKLNKEELLDRIKKMSKNNKQQEKSLAQLLELTKRFYVEQKAEQIRDKLVKLAKKEEELSNSNENTKVHQESINKEFEVIKNDMQALQKQNQELKEPMDINPQKPAQEAVQKDLNQATENLKKSSKSKASKSQKSAANKMKKMAQQMQSQMAAVQADMIEEDIALLRIIIENLLTFSFKQEHLMTTLSDMHPNHPNFPKKLREQHQLKQFFEHIDDSLYTLSLRQVKLAPKINEYLTDAQYYINETIVHYVDNQIHKALSDQQFVMTAANDLASMLSSLLENMQRAMMGMGKGSGKGKQGSSFSLPDIIQQQGSMIQKAKESLQKKANKPADKEGKGKGDKKSNSQGSGKSGEQSSKTGDGEEVSKELFEIYKQQASLRQAIEEQLNDLKSSGATPQTDKILQQMEALEKMLLDKGITTDLIQHMQALEHELLKLQEAKKERGQNSKRESTSSFTKYPTQSPQQIQFKKKYYDANEILMRDAIRLTPTYKKKIKEYFKQ